MTEPLPTAVMAAPDADPRLAARPSGPCPDESCGIDLHVIVVILRDLGWTSVQRSLELRQS